MSIIPGHMGDSSSCHSILCKEIKSSLFFSSLKITPGDCTMHILTKYKLEEK